MSKIHDNIMEIALQHSSPLLRHWLPNGKQQGREYVVADVSGGGGKSLSINMDKGVWSDFARPDQKGGSNLISLCMRLFNLDFRSACERTLADLASLGIKVADLSKTAGEKVKPEPEERAIFPVPDDAEPPPLAIGKGFSGKQAGYSLTQHWRYEDKDGRTLFYVLRYDHATEKKSTGKAAKQFKPMSYFGKEKGWVFKGIGLPQNPLYRLRDIHDKFDKLVLLVEGEKAADVGATLFPDCITTCWPGGTGQIGKADFSPLAGRDVIYWPDADEPGKTSIPLIVEMLRAVGVASLKVVMPSAMLPKGWDIADPAPEGFSLHAMLEKAEPVDLTTAIPLQNLPVKELVERLVYNSGTDQFIDTIGLYRFDRVMLDPLFRHRAEGRKRISELLLESPKIRKVLGLAYRPGCDDQVITDERGNLLFNAWRSSGIVPVDGDASILENHLRYLCPTNEEYAFLADMLAFMVQNQGEKLKFAAVLVGREGTGKSAIGALMRKLLGAHNTTEAQTAEIRSDFNEWVAEKQLVIVEEIMAQGRIEIMNVLKPLITQPKVAVNKKYVRRYEIENAANFIFLTNHKNALHIAPGDRRYFIIDSDREPQTKDYYRALFRWMEDQPGVALHWLLSRDLGGFDPNEPPPMTLGKAQMIEMSQDPRLRLIDEMIKARELPFEHDLIELPKVHAELTRQGSAAQGLTLNRVDLGKILEKLGARKLGQKSGTINGSLKRPSLWAIRDGDRYALMGAQRLVEEYMGYFSKANSPF